MKLEIPAPLRVEHEELHASLVRATKEPGAVGEAAREVARLLHPHFVREEEFALPPLALLAEMARSGVRPEMAQVLPMTRRLEAEVPAMLAEHAQIVHALDNLRADGPRRKSSRARAICRSSHASRPVRGTRALSSRDTNRPPCRAEPEDVMRGASEARPTALPVRGERSTSMLTIKATARPH